MTRLAIVSLVSVVALHACDSMADVLDTTDGCIGIATDAEMKAIADWMAKAKAKVIVILR